MPNHTSPIKRLRRDEKKKRDNHARIARIRTFIKKARDTFEGKESLEACKEAFRLAQSELARGVTKGALHRNNAARRTSRLAKAMEKAFPATAA